MITDDVQRIVSVKKIETPSTKNILLSDGEIQLNKLTLINYEVDKAVGGILVSDSGVKTIKIRKDVEEDLNNVKKRINKYGIPLTCEYSNTGFAEDSSDLGRVGLEIRLNSRAGFNKDSSYEEDDYFVGPSKTGLRVYGLVREELEFIDKTFVPKKQVYRIYDIRSTYNKEKPKVINIYKKFLDLTSIFNFYGFYQYPPTNNFLKKSLTEESNWNIFYYTKKLKIGQSYKSLLETVFEKQNSGIWLKSDKYWNGSVFDG